MPDCDGNLLRSYQLRKERAKVARQWQASFTLSLPQVSVHQRPAYPLSTRNLKEMMAERGVLVDHATVHRWALKMLPVLAKVGRRTTGGVRARCCPRPGRQSRSLSCQRLSSPRLS